MPTVAPLVETRPATGRDTTLDVLRGWFVVSMTIAHISLGSIAFKLTHAGVWIDGAIGFVTLSGLVLGMVHRRTHDRTGAVAYGKVWRRARLLYLVSLGFVVWALWMRQLTGRPENMTHPDEFGGWGPSLGLAASLQLPAPNLDVLQMYVVLFLLLVPALALLAAGRVRAVVAGSLALYAVAFVWPDLLLPPTLRDHHGVDFNWGTWQLPFMIGLVVGWSWTEHRVGERLRSRTGLLVALALAGTGFVMSVVFGRLGVLQGHPVGEGIGRAFAKWDLGPAAVVYGLAAIVVGYVLLPRLARFRVVRPVTDWLALLGTRSLDGFVILCVGVVVFPALLVYERHEPVAMALAVLTLAAQTAWAAARRARTRVTAAVAPR